MRDLNHSTHLLTAAGTNPGAVDDALCGNEERVHPLTPAEHVFDGIVYGGIGTAFNAGFSVWLADKVKRGAGAEMFDRSARWSAEHILPTFSNAPVEANIPKVRTFNTMMTLMAGGFILLAPMKWMEDKKPQITRWLHRNFTVSRDITHAVREEASLQELDRTPKQTWGSIISGRLAGIAVVFPTTWVASHAIEAIAKEGETFFADTAKMVSLGKHVTPTSRSYANLLTAEMIYAGTCSASLYAYTHFLCPPKHDEQQQATGQAQPSAHVLTGQLVAAPAVKHEIKAIKPKSYIERALQVEQQGNKHLSA